MLHSLSLGYQRWKRILVGCCLKLRVVLFWLSAYLSPVLRFCRTVKYVVFIYHPDRSFRGLHPLFWGRWLLFFGFGALWGWLVSPLPWYTYVVWCVYTFFVAPRYTGVRLEITVGFLCIFVSVELAYLCVGAYHLFRRKVMGWPSGENDLMKALQEVSRLGFLKYLVPVWGGYSYLAFGEDEDQVWCTRIVTLGEHVLSIAQVVFFPRLFSWLFGRLMRKFLYVFVLFGRGLSLPLRTFSLRGLLTDEEVKAAQHKLLLSGSVDLVPGFPRELNQEILEYLLGGWNAPVEQFEPTFPWEEEWFEECRRQGVSPLPFRCLCFRWVELFNRKLGVDTYGCSGQLHRVLNLMQRNPKVLDSVWHATPIFKAS